MKQTIVILTLMCLVTIWPLYASAGGLNATVNTPSIVENAEGDLLSGDFGGDGELPQQGANGDPHDLGGGFRGGEEPPEDDGIGGPFTEFLLFMECMFLIL